MECFGGDVNRMVCGGGEVVEVGLGGLSEVWLGLVKFVLSLDWAIVCGECYYPNLLQMQHFHPKTAPGLVITNSADNTR